MEDLELKQNPTLQDVQDYVEKMMRIRGFHDQELSKTFMLFLEECGELSKAARKSSRQLGVDKNSEEFDTEHEAADVFILLLAICNKLDINLESAFRKKEAINKKRKWE